MSMFRSMRRPTTSYHSASYDRIAKNHGFLGNGKTILVIGGSSGVGYEIAHAFATAGASRVAILARTLESLERAKGCLEAEFPSTEFPAFQASVTDKARLQSVFEQLGTIDVLVLGAASIHRRAKATELSSEDIQDSFDTNVIPTFEVAKAYLATPKPLSGGCRTIINITSAAFQTNSTLRVGYGSSKAAALSILQHFAAEHAHDQVRIFSFHPGFFFTPAMARQGFTKEGADWDDMRLPAHFALWLAGPQSDFLHGRMVWANWDVDELISLRPKLEQDKTMLTVGLQM